MKRIVWSAIVAVGAIVALSVSVTSQDNGLSATGLLPVHDSSGETHGELFAWYMTPAIYEAMQEGGRELVLLNPGGEYSPSDEAGALEFAREADVRTVVMTRLAPTRRSGPKDSSPELRVEVKVIDVKDGAALHRFSLGEEIARKDLERGFDFGPGFHDRRFMWIPGTHAKGYHRVSRKIEKQALGKIITRFADQIRANVLAFNGGALVYPSQALHPGVRPATCEADFNIRYVRQRAASKAYALIVNGREESVGINDGVARLTLHSGLNLFEVTVKDAPYRLPVQKEYDINRWIDCGPDDSHLTMEIGAAGEALIVGRS